LPSRAQKLLEDRIGQQSLGVLLVLLPGDSTAQPVNRSAQGTERTERIHHVGRGGIHDDILRAGSARQPEEHPYARTDSKNAQLYAC
jgi:hypothetical protein